MNQHFLSQPTDFHAEPVTNLKFITTRSVDFFTFARQCASHRTGAKILVNEGPFRLLPPGLNIQIAEYSKDGSVGWGETPSNPD